MAHQTYQIIFNGYWREPNVSGMPDHSGVYCAYTCTNNLLTNSIVLDRLIYIGEAGNVRDRIASHEGWEVWRTYLLPSQEVCFSTAPVTSTNRLRVEAALIHHHQSPANIEYKDSFPFDPTTVQTSGANHFLESFFMVQGNVPTPPWVRLTS